MRNEIIPVTAIRILLKKDSKKCVEETNMILKIKFLSSLWEKNLRFAYNEYA